MHSSAGSLDSFTKGRANMICWWVGRMQAKARNWIHLVNEENWGAGMENQEFFSAVFFLKCLSGAQVGSMEWAGFRGAARLRFLWEASAIVWSGVRWELSSGPFQNCEAQKRGLRKGFYFFLCSSKMKQHCMLLTFCPHIPTLSIILYSLELLNT